MNYYLRLDGTFDEIIREPLLRDGYGDLIWKHSLIEYKPIVDALVVNESVIFTHPLETESPYTSSDIETNDAGILPYDKFIEYAKECRHQFYLAISAFRITSTGVEIAFTKIVNNGYVNQTLRRIFIDNFLKEA